MTPPFRIQFFGLALIGLVLGCLLGMSLAGVAGVIGIMDTIIGTIVLIVVGAILLGSTASGLVSAFVDRLRQLSERVATGDVSPEFLVSAADELGSAGENLRYTAERLRGKVADLADEKEKLEQTLRTMSDGVLVCNRKKRIVLVNDAASQLLINGGESLLGRSLDVAAAPLEGIAGDALQGRRHITEILLDDNTTSNARISRHVAVKAVPLEDDSGSVTGALLLLEDVTESRRLDRLRRDFVANASHELKTPVTGIQLLSDALVNEIGDARADQTGLDQAASFARRLHDEAERLSRLTHDLLDLAEVEDQAPSSPVPVDIAATIREVISVSSLLMEERQVDCVFRRTGEEKSLVVEGDPHKIRTAILNLVENGIKYNRTGGNLSIEGGCDDDEIVVSFADEGPGISSEALPRIFERFYRVDLARSKETGGTGLGLSIVRHIVEGMGGRIEAESVLGEGSRFTIRLPASSQSVVRVIGDDEQTNS